VTTIAMILALAAPSGIEQVRWLAGCWESTDPARGIEESWMAPRGGTMLGAGRTVRNGRLVEYELVLVREDGERLAYEAHPSGQPSAVFLSKEVTPSRVVFENLEHDFPQRVGYELSGTDGLEAWIEGTAGGKLKRIEFPYRRVACGGSR
jgi:hypothetical protein